MSPTTVDAATLIFDLHLLNTSVRQPAATCTRQYGTLPTLDNFECRDELLVQLPLLGDAVEVLVDAEEPGVDVGKRNHWHI